MTCSSWKTAVAPVLKVTVAPDGTPSSAPLPAAIVLPRTPLWSNTSTPTSTGVVPKLLHMT